MIRIGIANLHNENHYTRLFPFSPYYAEIMLKMKKAYNPSYTAQTVGSFSYFCSTMSPSCIPSVTKVL